MEQKTEASQAVDEHKPCPFCGTAPRYLAKQEGIYCELVICDTCGLGLAPSSWSRRAALKAQPAPTSASVPLMYQQRMVAPNGNTGPWREANLEMYERYSANQDIGDGFKYEVRSLYAGQPAPTEAAQDALSANPNLTTSGVSCQPVAAQGNTSNNSSSSQLSGNSGELQPSGNTGELAQGEDSARLDFIAAHGCDGGDYGDSDWYVAGETYHGVTLREAIDRARASAETGGVKP